MWMLIVAVVTASLLGSLHCVGMCGPLAIWASNLGRHHARSQVAMASALYHFGRLATYSAAGLLAGTAGSFAELGGQALGFQLAAARLAGATMIWIGAWQVLKLLGAGGWRSGEHSVRPSMMTVVLVKLRPHVFSLPIFHRAFVTGLLTALLPCGWLYLFAIAAAGTGSAIAGISVMAAFWMGTVPALLGLSAATQILARRVRGGLPFFAAALLIVGGLYTTAGRGFANLQVFSDLSTVDRPSLEAKCATVAGQLDALTKKPLPCCHEY